ncbi:MAG: site-2 protease family protein [Caldimonas sp.]
MTRPLLSSEWYRLRALKPRLRGHVQIHRHAYRGQVWYVVEDRIGGKHHRFNFAAYRVISLMDGRRDMIGLWNALIADLNDETPTQDDVIRLLGQLHAADLVQVDITPDVAELFERRGKQQRRKWIGRFGNPIALRFPLFDPDPLLKRMLRVFGPLFGWPGALLWLAAVVPALLIVPSHWSELSGNGSERLLATDNLVLLAFLFPLVKAIHEFGHALTCRMRGGEVHEMGLMLLVFYPVPYVDVSNASALVSKWQRALIGAAGMLAELWVAAIAFFLWLVLEPGLLRAMAYDVAVLASVTTLFFNANPLLRYDGYYILADVIECPNLGVRANRYWQYLTERFVFGVRNPERAEITPGERRWFLGYAPLAYAYRLFVSISIAVLVASKFFFFGVVIAVWAVVSSVFWPIFKGLRALWSAPRFADRGPRIRAVLAGFVALGALALFAVPLPYHTHGEGVLWLPEQAILRAGSSGFVREVLLSSGAALQPGQAVVQAVEPGLAARIDVQDAKVEEIRTQFDAAWGVSQARAQQLEQELNRELASLARLRDEADKLTLRSPLAGTLLIDKPADLPGRFLRKGDVVGYVRTGDAPLVRVALAQSEVDMVRLSTRRVEVKMPQSLSETFVARLTRAVPAAARQLPSAVLGTKGGGPITIDPRDEKGLATLESVFEFELELPREVPHEWLGSRVHVRFEHAAEPVGQRMGRAVRRAFLSHFQV